MIAPDDNGSTSSDRRRGALILCGGASRRMGRPKAWLPFGDEVLLQRVVRRVAEGVGGGPVVVVASPDQELPPLPEGVAVARDPVAHRGPLQGIAVGLAALPETVEVAYASGTDVPFVESAWVAAVLDAVEGYDVAFPELGGYRHPLAAGYRRATVLPAALRLLAADRLRPIFLDETLRTRVLDADTLRAVDPEFRTVRNLNTPEDYEAARREAGFAAMD